MLRIRVRRCQGVAPPRQATSLRPRNNSWFNRARRSSGVWLSGPACIIFQEFSEKSLTKIGARPVPVGPIIFGTRVLLTRTGSNPILLGIGHCPTYQGRRKLIEKMEQEGVYRFGTGS